MSEPAPCPYQPLRRLGGGITTQVDVAAGPRGTVALKRPRSPEHARWLAQEARLLAILAGRGVADVIDHDEDGQWLALRLLPGPTLTDWSHGRSVVEVVEAIASLAGTLTALHDAGYVHGDVKPDNVMMGPRDSPCLIDLGLAVRPPGVHGFHGTFGAASPEQLRGEPATPASDIYALGALTVRALTGRRPFPPQRAAQALLPSDQLPMGPAMLREDIPDALDGLVCRMLDRQPERRPTGAGLAQALRSAATGPPTVVHPAVPHHWGLLGRMLVATVDRGAPGLVVTYGPEHPVHAALAQALARAADRENIPVEESGSCGLVLLSGPSGARRARALAETAAPALVVLHHATPLPDLTPLGAVHIDTRTSARAEPDAAATQRLLDALEQGPCTPGELARILGLGTLDLLELA
ncbi:MAG: serine/threonine-protein kinase, partial [Myxococcota bacterium]|nr:serine/threonine-protein kinase [Myxococcota bacterium]